MTKFSVSNSIFGAEREMGIAMTSEIALWNLAKSF